MVHPQAAGRQQGVDPPRNLVTLLIRARPGARYPSHRHSTCEECYVISGSVEYERTFRPRFAWAVFADAGDAWSDGSPDPKLGLGVGLRWNSPVGPVRIDIAHGLDEDADRSIEFHLSAGPDL